MQAAHTPGDKREANARLIAAAPELLAYAKEARLALSALLTDKPMLGAKRCGSNTLGNLRAELGGIIAKATGNAA